MKLQYFVVLSLCLAALSPLAANAQDTFTFESQTAGAFLPSGSSLTAESNPARTATFTVTSTDPAELINQAFQFQSNGVAPPNYGTNLSGTVLVAEGTDPNADTLTLTFAQPITSLTANFAITDFGDTYSVSLAGGGLTDTESGMLNGTSLNYEGTLMTGVLAPFTTASFTFFSSGAPTTYALDNVIVTPAATAVPEPGTLALGLALGLPVAWRVRKKLARK